MYNKAKHNDLNQVLHFLLIYLTVFLIFALLSTLGFKTFYPTGFDFKIDGNAFAYEYEGLPKLLADSLSASIGDLAVLLVILISTLSFIPRQICVCVFALRGFSAASVICKFISENSLKANAPVIFAIITSCVICAYYGAAATFFSQKPKRSTPFSPFLRSALFFPVFAGAICAVSAIKLYLLS